ncbi:FecR family protein [Butyricimonas synergistica]|uniref:FecR family protein n=1 Tax=Butyricimonas synergistica TaxID=544644 RepID=UPI00036E8EFA|nr:FecR domain-containing protein [Butyricimonas synergistica]
MSEMPEDIVRLVLKSLEECLTEDEQKHIDEWLQANPGRVEEMQQLKRYAAAGRDIRTFRQINIDDAWKRIDWQTEKAPGWKRRRMAPYWWSAAAVVVLVIVGVLFMNRPKEPVSTTLIASSAGFKPGSQKATWELPGGKLIELEEDGVRLLTGEDGSVLGRDSANTLIVGKGRKGEVEQSVIRVPQGGEYGVVLADGTKVWINSESELSFPSAFEGKDRVVELKGEAYFDVVKDAGHPFIVKTGETAIRVLGTSFNICGYAEDGYQQTTLVSGSVEVDYRGKQYRLTPGEQLEVREEGGEPEIRKVDVRLYTSWKDGMFRFLDMPLDELTVKLKRWYDVNFVFENEACKAYRFSGAVRKDVDFNEFIQLVETTTNVKFEIDGDNIVIKEK